MSKTSLFENYILRLIFNNEAIPNIGDASGLQPSAAAGNFYIALFTGDPTDAAETTNEADYTGYSRVAVPRTTGGFTVTDDNASNTALITFGECTGGANAITHFAVMTAVSGGDMIYHGVLSTTINVSTGIIPQFSIGALDVNED